MLDRTKALENLRAAETVIGCMKDELEARQKLALTLRGDPHLAALDYLAKSMRAMFDAMEAEEIEEGKYR